MDMHIEEFFIEKKSGSHKIHSTLPNGMSLLLISPVSAIGYIVFVYSPLGKVAADWCYPWVAWGKDCDLESTNLPSSFSTATG